MVPNTIPAHISQSQRVGSTVYSAGQLGFDASGRIQGGIGEQTRTALANLRAVLAAEGLGLDDVVKTTVWLRHAGDFTAFNAAYAAAFGAHRPARSTVISELVLPDALVEIEAIASPARGV